MGVPAYAATIDLDALANLFQRIESKDELVRTVTMHKADFDTVAWNDVLDTKDGKQTLWGAQVKLGGKRGLVTATSEIDGRTVSVSTEKLLGQGAR